VTPVKRPFSVLALLVVTTNLCAQTNVVQNGSFETYISVPYSVAPWTPTPSLNVNWWNAPNGKNYAYIDTTSQEVRTTPGLFYSLSFFTASDLLVNPVGTIQISWGNATLPSLSTVPHPYNPNVNRSDQIVWEHFTVDGLMATSDRTTLGFTATNGSMLFIDDVRLISVPEPTSLALFGFGASIFANAVKRRRNQISQKSG
jgi:hypothetical protein